MSKLTKTVIDRPVLAFIAVLTMLVFGVSSLLSMQQELTPNMALPALMIEVVYPGAAPDDVELLVTKKIEDGMASVNGIKNSLSYSYDSSSIVVYQFDYSVNLDNAFLDLQKKMEDIKAELPEGCEAPVIREMNNNDSSAMVLSVEAVKEGADLTTYALETAIPALKQLPDVANIKRMGGREKHVLVELDPLLSEQYGIGIGQVSETLAASDFIYPAGNAEMGNKKLTLTAIMRHGEAEELAKVPIKTDKGQVLALGDVAKVSLAEKEPDTLCRLNGVEGIALGVLKNQQASSVSLSKQVTEKLEQLNAEHPDTKLVVVFDSADSIISSLLTVANTLVIAVVLTMIVLFLFFGDIKASLIVGSSIPVSVLITLILISMMGFSLNMITLGALVIGIGMMVDNSIVVLDMCFRMQEEGLDFKDAAYQGTTAVILSVVASTATSVVVYLPIALLQGLTGQLFKPLGFTIIFALTASMVSAFTLVPLCFSLYRPKQKTDIPVNRFLNKVGEKYQKLLSRVMGHKIIVILIAVFLIAATAGLGSMLHSELMPSTEEGAVVIGIDLPTQTKDEELFGKVEAIEEFVTGSPYVKNGVMYIDIAGYYAEMTAYLADDCELSSQEVASLWGQEVMNYAGDCRVYVSALQSSGLSTGGAEVEIQLESNDLPLLKEAARDCADAFRNVDGVLSIVNSTAAQGMRAEVDIDPLKAEALGLSAREAAEQLYAAIHGVEAMEINLDGHKYKVDVKFPKEEYKNIADTEKLMFYTEEGKAIPFPEIAKIYYNDSPQEIAKQSGKFTATIISRLALEKRYDAEDEIYEILENEVEPNLPEGVVVGTYIVDLLMEEEFEALILAILAAVFLVFAVMAAEFNSLKYSLLVMICIPFSLAGALLMLLVFDCTINLTSLIGILMLAGIVVNNGIMFVDETNVLKEKMEITEALSEAGRSRLRPILMTTMTTVLSMIPQALAIGKNGGTMQGMAVAIIGGLTCSTLLTLLLLPTFYLMTQTKLQFKRQKGEDNGEEQNAAL